MNGKEIGVSVAQSGLKISSKRHTIKSKILTQITIRQYKTLFQMKMNFG